MNYKCCNPTCDNELSSQGPINALISSGDLSFQMSINLGSSAEISTESFHEMRKMLKGTDKAKLNVVDELRGSLGGFKIASYHVDLSNKEVVRHKKSYLTICCEVCNCCCEYSY
jgi:hypothetical protein